VLHTRPSHAPLVDHWNILRSTSVCNFLQLPLVSFLFGQNFLNRILSEIVTIANSINNRYKCSSSHINIVCIGVCDTEDGILRNVRLQTKEILSLKIPSNVWWRIRRLAGWVLYFLSEKLGKLLEDIGCLIKTSPEEKQTLVTCRKPTSRMTQLCQVNRKQMNDALSSYTSPRRLIKLQYSHTLRFY
jgi:hypothetical protein